MAGNTKFMGFGPPKTNTIQLMRWGTKVDVALPGAAIEQLREACYKKLPLGAPPARGSADASFNEQRGTVELEMSVQQAKRLRTLLECIDGQARKGKVTMESPNETTVEFEGTDTDLTDWTVGLMMAIEDGEKYFSTQDEPGIDS